MGAVSASSDDIAEDVVSSCNVENTNLVDEYQVSSGQSSLLIDSADTFTNLNELVINTS